MDLNHDGVITKAEFLQANRGGEQGRSNAAQTLSIPVNSKSKSPNKQLTVPLVLYVNSTTTQSILPALHLNGKCSGK